MSTQTRANPGHSALKDQGEKSKPSFFVAFDMFLNVLNPRSRAILEARYGVHTGTPKTLEEIGKEYRITRERVRQVIGSAFRMLREMQTLAHIAEIHLTIQSTLSGRSGIMRTEELFSSLAPDGTKERGALLAFLECFPTMTDERATEEWEHLWKLSHFPSEEWRAVKEAAKQILSEAEETLTESDFYRRYLGRGGKIDKKTFFDYLSVSKEVNRNVFGKWGLSHWSDVRPRGTREKAYLVLKTAKHPLHFREIAALIDEYGLQGKKSKSHPQTVHNELIKDDRFVLVGRGIYALLEWGYRRGTVKDVIADVLREAKRPLSREEILERVLQLRQVKKSTVVINMNAHCRRIGKNGYVLK